jgi:sugar phosphate isomerase/epimerase
MRIAYRVTRPEDVGRWDGEFAQLSVYRHWQGSLEGAGECVRLLKEQSIRYVIHPVGYSVAAGGDQEKTVMELAEVADLGIILHDERSPGGGRLSGEREERFRRVIADLSKMTAVSFENANDTGDAPWFWERFAESVTLDIGHVEGAGFDSVKYVSELPAAVVEKIDYVHMHHNNGLRGGLTDHWPLKEGCREMKALEALLDRWDGFDAILEINELEEVNESIRMLRALWSRLKGE